MFRRTTHKNPKGFTLIEMLVSVAIFAVVMVIALGALLAISESDRKAQTLKSIINNLNFALDSMSRSVRTGLNYHCGSAGTLSDPDDCISTPETSFAFQAADGATVRYCRGNGTLCNASGTAILRSVSTVNSGAFAPITSSEVQISRLLFYVIGAEGPTIQPKVTIVVSGYVQVSGGATSQTDCGTNSATCSTFNLQTSVTQRLYDI